MIHVSCHDALRLSAVSSGKAKAKAAAPKAAKSKPKPPPPAEDSDVELVSADLNWSSRKRPLPDRKPEEAGLRRLRPPKGAASRSWRKRCERCWSRRHAGAARWRSRWTSPRQRPTRRPRRGSSWSRNCHLTS